MQMNGNDLRFLQRKGRPPYEDGSNPVRVVDLFSGCGGLSLGIAEAARVVGRAFELRLSMELDSTIRSVFDANFTSVVTRDRADVFSRFDKHPGHALSLRERLTATEVGEVDFLVGGPPCQGHSDLNNHSRRSDPKNELYMVMVRAAEVLQPETVIIENVQGVQRDQSSVLTRAIEALEGLGYEVDDQLVRLTEIGVPQRRVRHVLFASKAFEPDIESALGTAMVRCPRTLRWAIGDLASGGREQLDTAAVLSKANMKRARYLLKNRRHDLPNWLRPPCHKDNPKHRYTAMYGRLKWNEPAHTITTGFGSPGQGRYLHPTKLRTLTPHEAARVQFFPDWFDFGEARLRSVLAHCIGNAVPPKLPFVLALNALAANRNAAESAQLDVG